MARSSTAKNTKAGYFYAAGSCFLLLWVVDVLRVHGLPLPPATSIHSPGTPTPRVLPTGSAENAARLRAVERYPDLAIAGSPLNSAFVARVHRYQLEKPEIFDDPDWPLLIAGECAADLR